MIVSWLSCLDNQGRFIMSINEKRWTAQRLLSGVCFQLDIATAGMEELLVRIGSCSGSLVDKMQFVPMAAVETHDSLWQGVQGCVGHLKCRVLEVLPRHGHRLLVCQIEEALVDSRYWDGKRLVASAQAKCPGLLSFCGTKTFVEMTPMDTH
ncbi:hypothetical protein HDU91_002260 [Kappamyces sp. JEL0680]|nr:hypothetical protein HDU91_002260 [Kappamyces sp. JEL0680]